MGKLQATRNLARHVSELRALAGLTADAALTAAPDHQSTVLDAAAKLNRIADGIERHGKKALEQQAVAELPSNATANELQHARRRQATRRGSEVFLPSWSAMARALPNAFLRSALFSARRSVQAGNTNLLAGESSQLVAGKEIASLRNMSLTLSGYELCQFDRLVYSTCLDYYRGTPLCPEESPRHVRTSFYEFIRHMGNEYSVKAHRATRASLLRLSFAQMRVRYEGMNIEVPKLLSVTFEDGQSTEDYRGSDVLLLRVTTSVAELFGPGNWTAVDNDAS